MKRTYVYLVIAGCSISNGYSHANPEVGYVCHEALKTLSEKRILNSPVIRAVDKFINSMLFNKILILRQQLTNMLYGTLTKDGARIGNYVWQGSAYNIQQLAHQTGDLIELLAQAKNDFEQQTGEFLGLAQSFKSQMLILIDESLRLHKRSDSILLSWAEAKEGLEMQSFETKVNSFTDFAQFLHDLLNYLDDLIASCPTAQKAFLQTKNDQEQKIFAQRFKGIYERQRHKIESLK